MLTADKLIYSQKLNHKCITFGSGIIQLSFICSEINKLCINCINALDDDILSYWRTQIDKAYQTAYWSSKHTYQA